MVIAQMRHSFCVAKMRRDIWHHPFFDLERTTCSKTMDVSGTPREKHVETLCFLSFFGIEPCRHDVCGGPLRDEKYISQSH